MGRSGGPTRLPGFGSRIFRSDSPPRYKTLPYNDLNLIPGPAPRPCGSRRPAPDCPYSRRGPAEQTDRLPGSCQRITQPFSSNSHSNSPPCCPSKVGLRPQPKGCHRRGPAHLSAYSSGDCVHRTTCPLAVYIIDSNSILENIDDANGQGRAPRQAFSDDLGRSTLLRRAAGDPRLRLVDDTAGPSYPWFRP